VRRVFGASAAALMVTACAAAKQEAAAPAATAPQEQGYPSAGAGYPAQPQPTASNQYAPPPSTVAPAQPGYPPAPPPPPAPEGAPQTELERAQRELDVAAGDCHNACRALGSMDRAAGRVCALSSGSNEDKQRCTSAKDRVYSARDKVKSSCGQCPDTSVDRSAPVPSR
jgi:hypothetical protein